jgi:hypothetical protein
MKIPRDAAMIMSMDLSARKSSSVKQEKTEKSII